MLKQWPIATDADRAAVGRMLNRGVLAGVGASEPRGLEAELAAAAAPARSCLTMNGGTASLHIRLAATGTGPGNVIVRSLSFIATA